jgi:coiled-coil domain-containing protein 115
MFGILILQALRLAQGGAIKMIEEIVPKVISVNAEIKEVEIKIRRARKHRAKAEALEKAMVGESRKEGVAS